MHNKKVLPASKDKCVSSDINVIPAPSNVHVAPLSIAKHNNRSLKTVTNKPSGTKNSSKTKNDQNVAAENDVQPHINYDQFLNSDSSFSRISSASFVKYFTIIKSSGDGHCFVYSIISSLKNQQDVNIELKPLLQSIINECTNYTGRYISLFENYPDLEYKMNNYVKNKMYNSIFCDMLSSVVANILQTPIVILYREDGHFNYHRISYVNENNASNIPIFIYKIGKHYDGLKFINGRNWKCLSPRESASRVHFSLEKRTQVHVTDVALSPCNDKNTVYNICDDKTSEAYPSKHDDNR